MSHSFVTEIDEKVAETGEIWKSGTWTTLKYMTRDKHRKIKPEKFVGGSGWKAPSYFRFWFSWFNREFHGRLQPGLPGTSILFRSRSGTGPRFFIFAGPIPDPVPGFAIPVWSRSRKIGDLKIQCFNVLTTHDSSIRALFWYLWMMSKYLDFMFDFEFRCIPRCAAI